MLFFNKFNANVKNKEPQVHCDFFCLPSILIPSDLKLVRIKKKNWLYHPIGQSFYTNDQP